MSNSPSIPGGYRPRSYSTYTPPKLDPGIERVMDNVNKNVQQLANEAPEKSPQPILDSLDGRFKNTLAGRFRALAAGLFTAKGSHNVGFEITTASLVDRKGEPGSARQLKIKLSSLTQKGRDQELTDAKTAVGICNKARLNPEQITTRDMKILENIAKSLPKNSELFQEIQSTTVKVLGYMVDSGEINESFAKSEMGQTAAQELLEGQCKRLTQDISHVSPDEIHKLHADECALSAKGALPEGFAITKNLGDLSESYLKFRHQELQKNISNTSADDILKLSSDCNSLDRLLIGDPPINKQDIQDLFQKFIRNQCQTLQKNISNASVDDILQLKSKLDTDCEKLKECLPENFSLKKDLEGVVQAFVTHRSSLAYLLQPEGNAVPKSIWDTSVNDVHQLINKLTADSEKLKTVLSQDFSIQTYAENLTQDYFKAKCCALKGVIYTHSANEMLKDITKLQSDAKELEEWAPVSTLIDLQKSLEDVAQSFIQNQCQELKENIAWASADKILQLESKVESDSRILASFLPEDFSLQDVQEQAAQSYFDHTWQGLCDGLSTSIALTDTQELEEAYSILQEYAPDSSISLDMKTALSSAIQIACQNVQKTEQELETASAAYAALPEENFNYDDLNDIAVYDSTRDSLKMDFDLKVQHFSMEGPSASLGRLYDGLNASDLKEIAGSLNEHKEALLDTLYNLQKALHTEGGMVPESLGIATKNVHAALESLENAFQDEISSLSENSNTISEKLEEALKETENAYRELGEIAGPAIDEAFRKCDEAREAEKAQQIEKEAKAKSEAQLQRNLVISDYNSAITEDSLNNRAGLEIACLRLGQFLPSDDPAFDEVEKLVPGFKDKLNAPQEDLIPSDLPSPDSENIINLGDLPPPPEGLGDLPLSPGHDASEYIGWSISSRNFDVC